jgi:hypothetical protein
MKTEATCNGCATLKCEVRESCPDNELSNKKDQLYAVDNGFLRFTT